MKKALLLSLFLFSLLQLRAQSGRITGRVTEKIAGAGLPGVSVVVRGTNSGTRTDDSGNFSLPVTRLRNVELEVDLLMLHLTFSLFIRCVPFPAARLMR